MLTSSPRRAKSADKIDGDTMMSFLLWITRDAPARQTSPLREATTGLTEVEVFIAKAILLIMMDLYVRERDPFNSSTNYDNYTRRICVDL